MTIFKLSYNSVVVTSKDEGARVEEFKSITFDLENKDNIIKLEELFRSHVYSLNKWIGKGNRGQKLSGGYEGYALNNNYTGMYGIALDYDDGTYTLDQAREAFKNYIHIIHTSSSHMIDVPRHKGIQPRFRVILPFKLSSEIPQVFENKVDGELVYNLLKERYASADPTVFSIGRKLYPFTGDQSRYEFYVNLPTNTKDTQDIKVSIDGQDEPTFYELTYKDLDDYRAILDVKQANKKRNKNDRKLNKNDIIVLKDRTTRKRISDIDKSNTPVFCLFCDDLESETSSGILNIDKHGNYNLHCFHCDQTYWEKDLTWKSEVEPSLFFDAKAGFPAMYDQDTGRLKYFKNDKDWVSYTTLEELPKEIYSKLPRCNTIVDMTKPFGVQDGPVGKVFNLFKPGEYLEDYKVVRARIKNNKQKPLDIKGLPTAIPTIWKVLENIFHTSDNYADLKCFLNWLAFLIQARRQSTLAWVIIAVPGSGKGVFTERVLKPIFGKHAVLIDAGSAIGAHFNIEDAACWIKAYNEVFTPSDFTQNLHRREWLKNRIGTNEIILEPKGVDKIVVKNNVNYLLFSNISRAFLIEVNDRRYNVVNTLKTSRKLTELEWFPEENEEFEKAIAEEVPSFAHYLQNIKYHTRSANEATDTPARAALIEASLESIDYVLNKLNAGDSDYFDLENVFPSSRGLVGIDPNSDIRAEIQEFIEKHHAIPSKYAAEVFGHFIKTTNKTNIKRQLEQRGVITGKQLWVKDRKQNVRVYIHESQLV